MVHVCKEKNIIRLAQKSHMTYTCWTCHSEYCRTCDCPSCDCPPSDSDTETPQNDKLETQSASTSKKSAPKRKTALVNSGRSASKRPARQINKVVESEVIVPKLCNLCGKQNVIHGERIYKSGWFNCSWRKDTDKACLFTVHTDCVGFPGLIDEDEIKTLPAFYCPSHKQNGRAHQNVESSYLSSEDSS